MRHRRSHPFPVIFDAIRGGFTILSGLALLVLGLTLKGISFVLKQINPAPWHCRLSLKRCGPGNSFPKATYFTGVFPVEATS
ncbi:MAG: hypothetical protein WCP35_18745 [Verrucomicrobiota bacterium]